MNFQIEKLARKIAEKEELVNVQIDIKVGSNKGDGLFGDIFMVSIADSNNLKLSLIFKCAIAHEAVAEKYYIKAVYENELHFYTKIIPAIKNFQKEANISHRFDATAKYYDFLFEGTTRIIALENLRARGFELFDKKSLLDGEHVEMVLKHYGRLHAFSFAYREKYAERFEEVTSRLHHIWRKFADHEAFTTTINRICKDLQIVLNNVENEHLKIKFEKYEDAARIFREVCQYKGKYSAIVHGDCWSNNMMFRYDYTHGKKSLKEMCFLDWQLAFLGTPVYDLSYFLYSSSSKAVFNKIELYLNIYYESFATTVREYGSDPERLYPYSQLKSDWKEYWKFGFILGLLLQRMKLINNEEIKDLQDLKENSEEDFQEDFFCASYEKQNFEERAVNLISHLNETGAL